MRVRNHAKMVDVYLATFNSKKGLLGNAKSVAEDIIQNPQNYHIYDGISTMTNISRYIVCLYILFPFTEKCKQSADY